VLVVASYTANPIEPGLGVTLAEADTHTPTIGFADYNQLFQVCLQPAAHGADEADEIIVLWRIEDVFERDFHTWAEGDTEALDRLVEGVRSLATTIAQLAGSVDATLLVSDATVPVGFGLDHGDPNVLDDLTTLARTANDAFDAALVDADVQGIDRLRTSALQLAAGSRQAFDRRNWLMYRQPYSNHFSHEIGVAIADAIASRLRVPPKVIVLDCDDTIWAGLAVDDGIGGLQSSDAFPGFAHRSFQLAVRRLRHRGVLLAIASKNDPETVEQAFDQVDGMVLTRDDIAGWRVSWGPKPEAIAELAAEFNLGLDSFVFVDDSSYEIGAVSTQLPDVITLQVPVDDIEALPDLLAESGLFRLMRVTDDDRARTGRMIAETGRTTAATAMSHEEFLADLDLHVTLLDVGPAEIGRTAQLVNKTNQFNLTTIRRTQADVAALADDPEHRVHAVAVHDRFGEYGIVGVVISAIDDDGWQLDTVLMSCRVLGRGVETAMLAGVVDQLRADHPGPVRGRHVPTDRNALVADLLLDHGFDPTDPGPGAALEAGGASFVLPADRSVILPGHITLHVTPHDHPHDHARERP